jgi:hypothetical protein
LTVPSELKACAGEVDGRPGLLAAAEPLGHFICGQIAVRLAMLCVGSRQYQEAHDADESQAPISP